jgi:hypothetical protein
VLPGSRVVPACTLYLIKPVETSTENEKLEYEHTEDVCVCVCVCMCNKPILYVHELH